MSHILSKYLPTFIYFILFILLQVSLNFLPCAQEKPALAGRRFIMVLIMVKKKKQSLYSHTDECKLFRAVFVLP